MRNRQFVQLDAVLLSGIPWIALGLRYETFNLTPEVRQAGIAFSVAALVVRLGVAHSFGLYRCLWRHASISELKRILRAGLVAAILTITVGSLGLTALRLAPEPLPLAVLVLDAILAVGVLAGPRLFARAAGARAGGSANDRRTIVVGAGAGGQMILRETRLNARLHLQVVAFADDAPEKQRTFLPGSRIPVLPSDAIGLDHRYVGILGISPDREHVLADKLTARCGDRLKLFSIFNRSPRKFAAALPIGV